MAGMPRLPARALLKIAEFELMACDHAGRSETLQLSITIRALIARLNIGDLRSVI